jgi:hypothetical protein
MVDLLGDIPADTLWLAVKSSCAEERAFAPSAGELRSKVTQLHSSGTPTAGEAWGAVLDKIRYNRNSEILRHPVVQRAVQAIGGIDSLGMSEQIDYDRAHFIKFYQQIYDRAVKEASELPEVVNYSKRLTGTIRLLEDK